jgi:hypothetical protein
MWLNLRDTPHRTVGLAICVACYVALALAVLLLSGCASARPQTRPTVSRLLLHVVESRTGLPFFGARVIVPARDYAQAATTDDQGAAWIYFPRYLQEIVFWVTAEGFQPVRVVLGELPQTEAMEWRAAIPLSALPDTRSLRVEE